MKNIKFNTYDFNISKALMKKLKPVFLNLIEENKQKNENLKEDFLWTVNYDVFEKQFSLSNRESVEAKIYKIYSGLKKSDEFDEKLYDKIYKEKEHLFFSIYYNYELYQAIEPDYYECDECPVYFYEDLDTTIKKVEKAKIELSKKYDEKLIELYNLKNKNFIPLKGKKINIVKNDDLQLKINKLFEKYDFSNLSEENIKEIVTNKDFKTFFELLIKFNILNSEK